jgi:hypothetical protein
MKTLIALILCTMSLTAAAGDAEETAAMMLNLDGLLCAEVTDLRALKQKDVYAVSCVKFRNGSEQATYVLDMSSGAGVRRVLGTNAWED